MPTSWPGSTPASGRWSLAGDARRRADARPPAGCRGPARPRRRGGPLGALRRRRAGDPLPTDVVDRPLALLEGADPVLRPPPPRARVRPARKRPLGAAFGERRLRRVGIRG